MAPPRPLFTVETGTNKPVERKIGHYSLLKDYLNVSSLSVVYDLEQQWILTNRYGE